MSKIGFLILTLTFLNSSISFANSDSKFEDLRHRFLEEYGPDIFKFSNKPFNILLDDESPNYFGGIRVDATEVVITIGREAQKEPGVTIDSYAAVLCHEVGHLLGGPPYKEKSASEFTSSTEGQSDFFAATQCLPKLLTKQNLLSDLEIQSLPLKWVRTCESSKRSLNHCLQILSAGYHLISSVHAIYLNYPQPPPHPDIDTPEAQGKSANQMYPSLQCRLDTYVRGALGIERPDCWY